MKTKPSSRRKEIIKATSISKKIKLVSDFDESVRMIGKYPVLVQYIKLSSITTDWMIDMSKKTNDKVFSDNLVSFTVDNLNNLQLYVENGDPSNQLRSLNQYMVQSLKKCFGK